MKKSKAFTLAETIMTLFIVGLVVTVSIPLFTQKKSTAPNTDIPWKYCDETKEMGLCQNKDLPIVVSSNSADAPDSGYNMTVYTGSNDYFSPYDMFTSDSREIKVGDYTFKEDKTNFYITNDVSNTFPNSINTINIGRDNRFGSRQNTNVVIGNNNRLNSAAGSSNSLVIGNTNTMTNSPNIVIGENNTVNTHSLAVGRNLNPSGRNNVVLIGDSINPPSNNYLNIADVIRGTSNEITFNGNVLLKGVLSAAVTDIASDERLKNIKGSYSKGLKEVLEVEPVIYKYKGQNEKHIGVVAQDLQKTFPEAVVKMPDGYLGINTDPLFFAMLNAMKEVNQKTDEEEQRQIRLQKEFEEIKAELETLSACKNDDFWSKIKCFWYDTKMFFKGLLANKSEVKNEKV